MMDMICTHWHHTWRHSALLTGQKGQFGKPRHRKHDVLDAQLLHQLYYWVMEVNVETCGHAKSHTEVGVESGQLCCRRHIEPRLTKQVVLPVPATYSATSIRTVGSLMMLYYNAWLHVTFQPTDSSQGTEVTSFLDMPCTDWRGFGETAGCNRLRYCFRQRPETMSQTKVSQPEHRNPLSHMTVRRRPAVCAV